MRGIVPRYTRLRYNGLRREGQSDRPDRGRIPRRVVQHECDHLDGILYPQRMTDMSRFGFNEELFPGEEIVDDEIEHDTARKPDTRVAHLLYLLHGLAPFTAWTLALVAVIISFSRATTFAGRGSRRTIPGSCAPSCGACSEWRSAGSSSSLSSASRSRFSSWTVTGIWYLYRVSPRLAAAERPASPRRDRGMRREA
jgi:hypothetical protein